MSEVLDRVEARGMAIGEERGKAIGKETATLSSIRSRMTALSSICRSST